MSMWTSFVVTPTGKDWAPSKVGETLKVFLDLSVMDHTGRSDPGPHPVGKAMLLPGGDLSVELVDTAAGRDAVALLRDDLVDVTLSQGTVRLR